MFEKRLLYRSKDGPRIIIIGAGVAGIAAASRLMRNGYTNIKIIEAENRIGGRVHSVPLKDCTVDLGAHWVHGETGNAVYELSKPYKLVGHSGDFNKVEFILSNGKELDSEVGMTIFEETGMLLEDHDTLKKFKGSLFDFFMEKSHKLASDKLSGDELEAYMNWLIKFECTIEGCDSLSEPSSKGLTHYKTCKGDILMDWMGEGYGTVLDLLLGSPKMRMEPQVNLSDKLILSTEVEQIDYSGMGVSVKCKGGGLYIGDYAIVTVSLGVLKEKYMSMFFPPLPLEKRKSIIGLSIGTVDKIYLKFPFTWWPKECSGFSLLWLKNEKMGKSSWEDEIIGFYTENSTPTTLTAWLVGEAAREMEIHTVDQVKNGCYRILRKFLSHKYDIPEPVDIARLYQNTGMSEGYVILRNGYRSIMDDKVLEVVRSSWYTNPHFQGSYSFRSLKTDALDVSASTLATPLKNKLGRDSVMFAGEATHDSFYSTVHGAIETGWREADKIIEINKTKPPLQRVDLVGYPQKKRGFVQFFIDYGTSKSSNKKKSFSP